MAKDKEKDCPQMLIKMAKTKWQRQVAITFLELHVKLSKVEVEVKHLKWLVLGVFAAVFFNVVVNLI